MARVACAERGQSSVEYALVLLAFLSLVLAFGALWHLAESDTLTRGVRKADAHGLEHGVGPGRIQDVLAY